MVGLLIGFLWHNAHKFSHGSEYQKQIKISNELERENKRKLSDERKHTGRIKINFHTDQRYPAKLMESIQISQGRKVKTFNLAQNRR